MTNHRVVVMLVVRLTSPNLSFISKILRCRLVLQSNLFAPGFYMHQYLLEGKSAERAAWAGSEKKKYASFAVDPMKRSRWNSFQRCLVKAYSSTQGNVSPHPPLQVSSIFARASVSLRLLVAFIPPSLMIIRTA